jgi:Tfp pilus assembly protein PilF
MHQRYQAAIEAYRTGARNSATLWNKMGIANQLMLNESEALRCYQIALKLEPRNAHVLNNLGTIYDAQKRYSDAEHMYRRALLAEPKSALIEKNLGTALLAQHKYKKGWEAYQAALALDPNVFESDKALRVDNPATVAERGAMNYYMARGCVRAGMNERAIEYLRKALTEGFINSKKLVADNEFASLHGLPAFEELVGVTQQP